MKYDFSVETEQGLNLGVRVTSRVYEFVIGGEFYYGYAERQKNGGYVLRVINRTNDVSVEQGLIAWMKKEVEDVTSE